MLPTTLRDETNAPASRPGSPTVAAVDARAWLVGSSEPGRAPAQAASLRVEMPRTAVAGSGPGAAFGSELKLVPFSYPDPVLIARDSSDASVFEQHRHARHTRGVRIDSTMALAVVLFVVALVLSAIVIRDSGVERTQIAEATPVVEMNPSATTVGGGAASDAT